MFLLAVTVAAGAQISTFDQIPTIVQQKSAAAESIAYAQNIVSGNVLWVMYHSRNPSAAPTISDTKGNTWTKIIDINGTDGRNHFYWWTATANGSGADTVTLTVTGTTNHRMSVWEWKNVTDAIDMSATTQSAFSGGSVTLPTVTTTIYRDLIVNVGQSVGDQTMFPALNSQYQPALHLDGSDDTYVQYLIQNSTPGSTSTTFSGSTANRNMALATVAFKSSSSLATCTASLPNAVVNQTYSVTLCAKGGAGTNTWAVTSGALPSGLSLSSGGVISGTPTSSAAGGITFQVTDSASATASTASLTLHVGTSASTPAIVRTCTGSGSSCTLASGANTVAVGDLILVTNLVASSTQIFTPLITDTLGTVFYPLNGASAGEDDTHAYTITQVGFATSSGNDTISCSGCSNLGVVEISNIQQFFDSTIVNVTNSFSGGATYTSGSITLPVAELFFGIAVALTNNPGVTSLSPNSPLAATGATFSNTSGYYSWAANTGAAAGATTGVWTPTSNTTGHWMISVFGLRPTTSGTAATRVRHHSTIM